MRRPEHVEMGVAGARRRRKARLARIGIGRKIHSELRVHGISLRLAAKQVPGSSTSIPWHWSYPSNPVLRGAITKGVRRATVRESRGMAMPRPPHRTGPPARGQSPGRPSPRFNAMFRYARCSCRLNFRSDPSATVINTRTKNAVCQERTSRPLPRVGAIV